MDRWPLLEIGCGRGIVVDHLRCRGIDCIGCDLAPAPVPDHLRCVVLDQTDFADLPAGQRSGIRRVLLCDVNEHLPNPVSFLRKVRDALPALEGLLVTVPAQAQQKLWSDWDRRCGHFQRLRIVRRSTLPGSSHSLPGTSSTPSICPPFLPRGGKLRSTSVKAPSLSWLHEVVGAAFQVEERVFLSPLPGTSAMMTAFDG
jgi:hypothetical protein